MKITRTGKPPWVGLYECNFCDSVFEINVEDGRSIRSIDPHPYGTVVDAITLERCPVCGQRRSLWFDRVGDVPASDEVVETESTDA